MLYFKWIDLAFIILTLSSCSLQKLAISQMEPIFDNSAEALFEESDYELAGQALPGSLKLIEGLIKSDPENERLLLLAAQGYAGYALGYLEDQSPQRAKNIYLKARDFALRLLRKDPAFIKAEKEGLAAMQKLAGNYGIDKVPALFWAGFSWAGYINLSLTEPSAIADLSTVQVFMERVEQLQPEYFYGGVYLFFGSVWGMKPRMLGGDPEKAKAYFEKNIALNHGNFLLAYIYAARYYAAKALDEEAFDSYMQAVGDTPVDVIPKAALMNAVAKEKAKFLKNMKEELF
jgi:tetratricopeptide (TPR) repeat protein